MVFSDYNLFIRQQPVAARACGSADRPDRRPIDPVVILQLTHRNNTELYADGDTATFFCVATLIETPARSTISFDAAAQQEPQPVSSNLLTGTILSSIFYLKDPATDNKTGAFFVFPDLNIRPEGSYRLRFDVFGISDGRASPLAHCLSAVFTVYSAKRFPGMTNSTELSKTFSDQGLKIRIRKDIRVRKKARLERTLSEDKQPGRQVTPSTGASLAGGKLMPLAPVTEEKTETQHFSGDAGSAQQQRLQPPVNTEATSARDTYQAQQHDHDHFRVRHPYNTDYDRYYRRDLQPVLQSLPAPLLTSSSSEREDDGTMYQRLSMDASYPSPRTQVAYAENSGPFTSRHNGERGPQFVRPQPPPMRFPQESRSWKPPALPKLAAPIQHWEEMTTRRETDNYNQRPHTVADSNRLPSFTEAFAAYDHQTPMHVDGMRSYATQPTVASRPKESSQVNSRSNSHDNWNARPS